MTANELTGQIRSKGKHLAKRLRSYHDALSQRQRLWVILAMLAAFLALDVCVLAWSFNRIRIEHIQPFNP